MKKLDLGITTYLFLFLNCILLISGVFKFVIVFAFGIATLFVFPYLKDTTYTAYVSDAVITGMFETAIAILGLLAGNKNNVRFLNRYLFLIFLLTISKSISLNQLHESERIIKKDIKIMLNDAMNEYKVSKSPSKVEDIQRMYECCGIDGPDFWNQSAKLPLSCCPSKIKLCNETYAYKEGCLQKMQFNLPFHLFNIEYYATFPVIEGLVFFVGIVLIVMVRKTTSNTLA